MGCRVSEWIRVRVFEPSWGGAATEEGRKEGRKVKIKIVEILMARLISKSGCMSYTCTKMGEVLVD